MLLLATCLKMTGDGICMIQSKEVTGWVSCYRKTFFKALMSHYDVLRTWICVDYFHLILEAHIIFSCHI